MKLYNEQEFKVYVADIETLSCLMDFGFYNPDEDKWYEFEISEFRNDLYSFIKFYNPANIDYCVYYNGISFDAQVIQFVINNYQNWYDLSNQEIIDRIYQFTQDLIDDANNHLRLPYQEWEFSVKVIDVYRVFGLDNEARRSSLKKCEFQIDWNSVEEMPIHHNTPDLSREQIEEVKGYRRNDVMATFELLKTVMGNTSHPVYKDNNQLELRHNLSKEFGIDCLNYSDIKIGDELLKSSYQKVIKGDVPKKGTFRKSIRLSNCIPKYVEFQTEQLKNLLSYLKSQLLYQDGKLDNVFEFYGTEYTLALGGLHSKNDREVYESTSDIQIVDWDVSSMYPAIIVNNGYYPHHLGKDLLRVYKQIYDKRLSLKPMAKKDKKIKGIVEGYKLMLNAAFGKMGSMDSWLYDKQTLLSVTLTGQLSLLMLIEQYELNGIHVISANTDGITTLVSGEQQELMDEINRKWEQVTNFVLEKTEYKKIIYSTVNDYLAIKSDDSVKKKGDLITEFDLWKNKSWRVIPLALEEYFTKGTDPKDFIHNHNNIFDFCIMARATGTLHLEEQYLSGDREITINIYKKLIRYYLSNTGKELYKRGIGSTGKKSNVSVNAPNLIGKNYIQYFNKYEEKPISEYNIDYNQYIWRCYKFIDKIEKTRKADRFVEHVKQVNQLSLF